MVNNALKYFEEYGRLELAKLILNNSATRFERWQTSTSHQDVLGPLEQLALLLGIFRKAQVSSSVKLQFFANPELMKPEAYAMKFHSNPR